MRLGLFTAVACALPFTAVAQPDSDVPACRAVPPVEDVRLADAPAALLEALKRDIGQYVGPGEPFDAFDEVRTGIHKQILWIRHREDRWVVAYWRGGYFVELPILVYDLPRKGAAVRLSTTAAFPGSVCQLTERELYR